MVESSSSRMGHLMQIGGERHSQATRGDRSRGEAVFTGFLRHLEGPAAPGELDGFEEVWDALRQLLVSELKRRGLSTLPPAFLGIYGYAAWADGDALEELVADCFLFVFGERLRSLKAHLHFMPNVEGLIVRSVRNFLHETQKRHDPVGFRVFTVLRNAVRAAVAGGVLHVVAGSPEIRRCTVLAFLAGSSPAAAARPEELDRGARAWNDDLLPDLIPAQG
ncbi:MAG: hypothetical protein M3O15_03010, partial [Acidobacteriota bacterium]|nr:hypothetical protein [Acidobacteriota bacterium]